MENPSAMGRASDVAVEWEGLVMMWQTVFIERASGGPSGRDATGDTVGKLGCQFMRNFYYNN